MCVAWNGRLQRGLAAPPPDFEWDFQEPRIRPGRGGRRSRSHGSPHLDSRDVGLTRTVSLPSLLFLACLSRSPFLYLTE